MKFFQTGLAVVVTECQKLFSFLPLRYQVDIRYASFMLCFMAAYNYICNFLPYKPLEYQQTYILVTVTLLIASIP